MCLCPAVELISIGNAWRRISGRSRRCFESTRGVSVDIFQLPIQKNSGTGGEFILCRVWWEPGLGPLMLMMCAQGSGLAPLMLMMRAPSVAKGAHELSRGPDHHPRVPRCS